MADTMTHPPPANTQPEVEEDLCGPVDKSRRKEDLLTIAKAIKLSGYDTPEFAKLTKAKLVPLLQKHLTDHSATLSTSKRFQKLYTYGKRSNARGAQVAGKNSAHKVAEDVVEQQKMQTEARGAHKALLDAKRTTDPPGQRRHYQSSVTNAGTAIKNTSSARDTRSSARSSTRSPSLSPPPASLPPLSPPLSPSRLQHDHLLPPPILLTPIAAEVNPVTTTGWPNGFESPAHQQTELQLGSPGHIDRHPSRFQAPESPVPSTPRKQRRAKSDVCVTFRDYDGRRDSQQVWVADMPVESRPSPDGKHEEFFVNLSDVVPVALEQDTPLRNTCGRVWRDATSGDHAKTNIGSVRTLIEERQTKALGLPRVDRYRLAQLPDGELMCELLLQREESAPLDVLPTLNRQSPTPASLPKKVSHATHSKTVESSGSTFTPRQVIDFLRQELNPPSEWARSETAGQCLDRFLAVEEAWSYLRGVRVTHSASGGWKFPDDHEELPGARFTKENVLEALNIKKGTNNADTNLFKIESSRQHALKNWIDEPNDPMLHAKFWKMSINELKSWKSRHQDKRASGSSFAGRTNGKGKGTDRMVRAKGGSKRMREESGDSSSDPQTSEASDSEIEVSKSRKGKEKSSSFKRQKYAHGSDSLDE